MKHSFTQALEVPCRCGIAYEADVFLVVDPTEDLQLAQIIERGAINFVDCPSCNGSVRAPFPVMLLQSTEIPPIIMAAPPGLSQEEVVPMLDALLGMWVSRLDPEARTMLSASAFSLHPLIVPLDELSRFSDTVGRRPSAVAWKAAFSILGQQPLPKELFAELATRALSRWTCDDPPYQLAYIKGRLGTAIDEPELAITYLSEALDVLKPDECPDWSRWKYDLGCLYAQRAVSDPARNIELAIVAFEDALASMPPGKEDLIWAMCSSNLSIQYQIRLLGERAENCERALHHIQNTFRVFLPERYTEQCARSHQVAGEVLRDRLLEDRDQNLFQAIEHYQLALQLFDSMGSAGESATTHALIGQAHLLRAMAEGSKSGYAQEAIQHIKVALKTFTRGREPLKWAGNIHNVAIAYRYLPGDHGENAKKSIKYFNQALNVFTRNRCPLEWADCQANLGGLIGASHRGVTAERAAKAIHHYRDALTVYTEDGQPSKYMETQEALADIYYHQQQYEDAFQAYEAALRVKETLFGQSFTPAGRQLELHSVAKISSRTVTSLIQLGRYQQALDVLEHWRARLLRDAMAPERILDGDVGDSDRALLRDNSRKIREIEARLGTSAGRRGNLRALTVELYAARALSQELIDRIRGMRHDVEAGADIFSLVPVGGALIVTVPSQEPVLFFFVIEYGAQAICFDDVPMVIQPLFGATSNGIEPLYQFDQAGEMPPRTFSRYLAFLASNKTEMLIDRLARCELAADSPVVVIGTPLEIFGVHTGTVWTRDGQTEFLDHYTIRYAPGTDMLRLCEERRARRGTARSSLTAVVDPTQDLDFAALEATLATVAFDQSECFTGGDATSSAVIASGAQCGYLHFACHGFSSLDDPLDSSLTLAKGMRLTAAQIISDFDLSNCHLVVLSGCQTGLVNSKALGAEYLGLPIAFLQAGASAVISTLWRVNDVSTMLLMRRFYSLHRRSGQPASVALGKAQRWLRSARNADIAQVFEEILASTGISNGPSHRIARAAFRRSTLSNQNECPFSDPYFWGPFIYMGAEIFAT